jgi:hypothetical protein
VRRVCERGRQHRVCAAHAASLLARGRMGAGADACVARLRACVNRHHAQHTQQQATWPAAACSEHAARCQHTQPEARRNKTRTRRCSEMCCCFAFSEQRQ